MSNRFSDLGISSPILKAIEEMGFEEPTEVQSRAIPHILKQEDLIVNSKTGSGKTAVFGVSVLQLTDPSAPGPQGLILTPTRELAVQVDNDIKLLSKYLQHKTAVLYGQHNLNAEIKELKNRPAIVTGTPGRVFSHIRQGNLQTGNIRFLVLDEADRMLDMGFLDQVVRIIMTIPKDRVTLLFSATIPPEIRRISTKYMKNPEMIEIESPTKTVDAIRQIYYRVAHNEKYTQLNRILLVEQPDSCMIFCNTRAAVDRVQSFLTRKGYASQALHGDIPQNRRLKTIQQFKHGEFHILVATDVAARGIHIDNLALVINYDVPVEKDSYIHRIGRTGRAGNAGRSVTLVTGDDIMSLYEIEEHIGTMIEEAELPSEDLFNERKASAGNWLEANALKAGASRGSTKMSNGVRNKQRNKHPFAKNNRPQQNGRRRGRPGSSEQIVGMHQDNLTNRGESAIRPAGGNRPAGKRRPAGDRHTAGAYQPAGGKRAASTRQHCIGERNANTRSSCSHGLADAPQPAPKLASTRPEENRAVQAGKGQEKSSVKSLLRRIISRILGK